ncbi:hypothetical protein [Massilia sp. TWP1-3-3]|uniref:hypothetical protein n=1 Tax=Massilia sp. TWP1-3-3 TaxID=2804573 RepID=UPI003CF06B19
MFWFHHPKPFNQKAVVMQIVQRKAAAVGDTSLIILESAPQGPDAAAQSPPLLVPKKP